MRETSMARTRVCLGCSLGGTTYITADGPKDHPWKPYFVRGIHFGGPSIA